MAKITINLAGEHTVTKGPRDKSWVASVSVDLATLSAEMVEKLAVHGLQQKIADAASGAQTADEAGASMSKAVNAILAGDWSSRVAGSGVDETTLVQRSVTRAAFKAKVGAKSEAWAKFTGMDDSAANAKLDEWFASEVEALQPAVDAELAERKAKRERKAKLGAGMEFAL